MSRIVLIVLLVFAITNVAQAHSAEHVERVVVGPYALVVEHTYWPVKAQTNVDLVVIVSGGDEGKTVYGKLIAPPESTIRPTRSVLISHPNMADSLTIHNYKIRESGIWQLEFEIVGHDGTFTGRTKPFTVDGPPAFPLWVGNLITIIPAVGFAVFLWRERRRVRLAVAADGAARA